jgi:hypothetical protein
VAEIRHSVDATPQTGNMEIPPQVGNVDITPQVVNVDIAPQVISYKDLVESLVKPND